MQRRERGSSSNWIAALCVAASLFAASPLAARDYSESRKACSQSDPLRQPYFGDTHVHTVYSFDANGQDTRNTPRARR